ncbi:hypothetical protein SAMN04487912_106140 [Arthrobacter sp. cf158]|uniref:hypothetical protein n=1 Tax=Arthrobacter sp. cf158 TaxID=1761744 RepID=UPI0008966E09|nr:hypothetical protein [Arthrobacter sp. cf158]SDW99268.1 hypothetical protein SAMN04487912_106140 [Arthrobacter sp. cf158]
MTVNTIGTRRSSIFLRCNRRQVDIVRDLVGDVPVTGALCYLEADWPLIGGAFSTRGVHMLWPKRLAKVLMEQTAGDSDVAAMREAVASRFKSA